MPKVVVTAAQAAKIKPIAKTRNATAYAAHDARVLAGADNFYTLERGGHGGSRMKMLKTDFGMDISAAIAYAEANPQAILYAANSRMQCGCIIKADQFAGLLAKG